MPRVANNARALVQLVQQRLNLAVQHPLRPATGSDSSPLSGSRNTSPQDTSGEIRQKWRDPGAYSQGCSVRLSGIAARHGLKGAASEARRRQRQSAPHRLRFADGAGDGRTQDQRTVSGPRGRRAKSCHYRPCYLPALPLAVVRRARPSAGPPQTQSHDWPWMPMWRR